MRILYLNPGAQMGGAETSLLELLAGVRTAEPDWDLTLVLGGDGPLVEKAEALGVRVQVVPMPDSLAKFGDSGARSRTGLIAALFSAVPYMLRLSKAVRELEPDLIHSTGFKMHVMSTWIRPGRVPLLWHIHDYVQSRPLMSLLLGWHARWCTRAIANSKSVAADLRAATGGRLRAQTILNAIDLRRFSPRGPLLNLDALSQLPPAPEGTIRVGLVATFAHWKGHSVFLKALSLLPPDTPVRGYIVGGPVYQTAGSQVSLERLQSEARELCIIDKVGFTGFVDDTAAAMRALDVVVHASTSPEPFGMVIVEGMACGKAVIVSDAGGASEIFRDGIDAIGHPPGDAQALSHQIARLANDRELQMRLGRAAMHGVEEIYESARLAAEITRVYRQFSKDQVAAHDGAVAHR